MSTFTISEHPCGEDARSWRHAPDLGAPLPLGHHQAVRRAVELRRRGRNWTWTTIAVVMGEYHGFWRSAGWWAREVKLCDRTLARPRGVPFDGPYEAGRRG